MEIEDRVKTVKNLIKDTFAFLEQLGYQFAIEEAKDNTAKETLKVRYKNELACRVIFIQYSYRIIDSKDIYSFHLTVTLLPYSNPDVGFDYSKDYFSLSEYLKFNDIDFSPKFIGDFDKSEAKNILSKTAILLKEHVWAIITGEHWYQGYYPKW